MHYFACFKQYVNGTTLYKSFCNLLDTQHRTHLKCYLKRLRVNTLQVIHPLPPDGFPLSVSLLLQTTIGEGLHASSWYTSDCWEGLTLGVGCGVCISSPCQTVLHSDCTINTVSRRGSKFPLFHILSNTWYYEGFKPCQSDGYERETCSFKLHVTKESRPPKCDYVDHRFQLPKSHFHHTLLSLPKVTSRQTGLRLCLQHSISHSCEGFRNKYV